MVDRNTIFGGMMTNQGVAKKTNCDALGVPWEPSHMLIGDAGGTDPIPRPDQTQLINQVHRAQLNQLRVSPTDPNVLIAEVVLPPDIGGWWMRELALEDKDGVFSAVASVAPSYKPLLAQGSGRNQVVRMHIITNGTGNIQLKIDPSVVLATREYVDLNRQEIEALIAQASALPVGTIVAFPTDSLPPGFLELDGSSHSSNAYPDLSRYLAGTYNNGSEQLGYFRLPESRGEFFRGWDHGRGVDTRRDLGSSQLGTVVAYDSNAPGGASVDIIRSTAAQAAADPYDPAIYPGLSITFTTTGLNHGPGLSDGGVTRPRNIAVMWCIKAWNAPINQGNVDVAALVPLAAEATESHRGTASIATDAQVSGGVDDSAIVTPKKLRRGFAISLATNGYVALPSWLGGLILQWGYVQAPLYSSANTFIEMPITWPIAFPTKIRAVANSIVTGITPLAFTNTSIEARTETGAVWIYSSGTAGASPILSYIAVGY